jgi:hypothetical protein
VELAVDGADEAEEVAGEPPLLAAETPPATATVAAGSGTETTPDDVTVRAASACVTTTRA